MRALVNGPGGGTIDDPATPTISERRGLCLRSGDISEVNGGLLSGRQASMLRGGCQRPLLFLQSSRAESGERIAGQLPCAGPRTLSRPVLRSAGHRRGQVGAWTRREGGGRYGVGAMPKAARVLAALKRDGWTETRRRGSHRVLVKGDRQRIWAYHEGVDLGGPAMARIAKDYGYSLAELRRL
jgi:predicted RNA binding protein YcfA (HicA-like mRNA interferase family)